MNNLEEESLDDKGDESSTISVDGGCEKLFNNAEKQVQRFFSERKIFELFNFLMSHLLVDEPDNPIEYLYHLIDRCLLFRSGLVEPPLLFNKRHIESIFQNLDPNGTGSISLDGYKSGMKTLGIEPYHEDPQQFLPGLVDKAVFVNDADESAARFYISVCFIMGKISEALVFFCDCECAMFSETAETRAVKNGLVNVLSQMVGNPEFKSEHHPE